MGAFDISYNDIAGAPLGSGKKKVAPIQAAQGIAAPTAALSSPQLIDARQSITQAPTVQQLVPAQSITQGAESYMRAHQPGDAVAISYPPIMPDATTSPRPVPVMPTPPGIAKSMSGGAGQQPAPATIADIRTPNTQAQPMRSQPVVRQPSVQAAPAQAQTVDDGYGGVYTPGGGAIPPDKTGIASGIVNLFRDSAQAARTGVNYDQVKANRMAAENSAAVSMAPAAQVAAAQSPATEFKQDPFGPKPDALAIQPSNDGQFITGKNGSAPDSSGGGFTKGGVSYNVNPSDQEGIAKITAPGKNPLYTNIRPEDAVAGLKNQSVGGDPQEGLNRMARANATWQEVIDKQPVGGVSILGDGGVEAANAEKTARWRQDDLLAQAKSGNRAAGEVAQEAVRGQNIIATEGIRAGAQLAAESGRNSVTMRGQDMTALSDANRLAGNPVDNELKRAQAGGIAAQTESAKMLADIQRKALAGDQQAAATYRALTGKGNAADRYLTVQGGEEVGPDGMTRIKRPSAVFDAQSGQFVSPDQQKG